MTDNSVSRRLFMSARRRFQQHRLRNVVDKKRGH